jgi:hypothetical protein
MFPGLTNLLLLATVMAHAIFGCCLHHQHSAASSLPAGYQAHSTCCAHSCQTQPNTQIPADNAPPAEHCAAEDCLFVDTRPDLPELTSGSGIRLWAAADFPVASAGLRRISNSAGDSAAHHCSAGPTRARLCCWLV